jgi:wobble nucleotide-excising tRNase
MAAIRKIKRVQGIGVFHDFSWTAGLDDFQAYNLIYGLNGSGKTTLSNILRCLELKKCTEGQFTVTADGADISSAVLATHVGLPQIKVFNRDFVADNVFTSFGTCCPIFFLGEDSAAKRKQIEEKEVEKGKQETALVEVERNEERKKKSLDDLRIATAGTIKELLRSAGTGNAYNSYHKGDFKAKCDAHKKAGTKPRTLSDDEKALHKAVAAGTAKPEIPEIQFTTPDLEAVKATTETVLSRRVVSEVIETLKSRPDVNFWVGQGLKLHKELEVKVCQFCEGPLPDERIQKLEKHFSDEYAAVIKAVSEARASIATHTAALAELTVPDEARVYDDFVVPYRTAVNLIGEARRSIEGFLKSCDDALKTKQTNPFEIVALSAEVPASIDITSINEQLRAHNDRTKNFQLEIAAARAALEEAIIAEKFDKVVELEGEIAAAAGEAGRLRSSIAALRADVLKLDGEIKEHRRPAEQINADLASYLGRKDITLAVEDAGYRIMRDGIPATKLSEGEKTALAIIYFLKSLEDRGFDKTKGIVVIDDPVSSLDANALFYAFSFIQDRTKDVGQLFITTHNFGFLRLVRKWLFRVNKTKKKTKKEARMYMLNCLGSSSGRRAELAALDPLLSEYESEYSYLFSQVVKGAGDSAGEIEKFYHYPNIARRVLEAFLAFRMPNSAHTWEDNRFNSDMHGYLHELGFDAAKTNRILNFLNAHSHNARPDGSVDHDESILLETPAVLADVLELIEHADSNHCTEMKKLVSPPPAVP